MLGALWSAGSKWVKIFERAVEQMGVQGALLGAAGFFALDYAKINAGINVFGGNYNDAAAAVTVVPLAGAIVGYYYL